MAEKPKEDVSCRVTVHPAAAAWANTGKLDFTPQAGLDQIEASLTLTGQPDWKPDGDVAYTVRLGPCTSADPRFHGIGFPQQPAVTSIRLVNYDVSFPLVTAVVPSAVHTSGHSVTVRGTNFGPDALVFFCGSVLGHSSVPGKWVWVHNNATGSDLPIRRAQLALLRHVVVGGDNSDSITIDELGMNSTLCDAMGQEGFELSNCTGGVLDFEPDADPELSALLRVRYVNDSVFTFVTPCLSKVVLLPRMPAACRGLPVSDVCAVLQPIEGGFAQVVMAMPDRRRRSPITIDAERGLIPLELMRGSIVSLISRCDKEGFALIGDKCQPCPSGGSCPGTRLQAVGRQCQSLAQACWTAGGGRVWPNKGFWNRGEMSGFVSRCHPSLRCLGGQFSQCAVGYEADYCSKCNTGYVHGANHLAAVSFETGNAPGSSHTVENAFHVARRQ